MADYLDLREQGASIINDFGHAFCGRKLGNGIARDVYEMATDPTKVIKIETTSRSFQNAAEWEIWNELKGTVHAKWLAPCCHISPSGTVLVMERTQPLRDGEEPQRVPAWLCDLHRGNYGVLNGKVVCHDYGFTQFINRGVTRKMVKAAWRR